MFLGLIPTVVMIDHSSDCCNDNQCHTIPTVIMITTVTIYPTFVTITTAKKFFLQNLKDILIVTTNYMKPTKIELIQKSIHQIIRSKVSFNKMPTTDSMSN